MAQLKKQMISSREGEQQNEEAKENEISNEEILDEDNREDFF